MAGGPGRPSKVARVIDEYDLVDLGAELERRWTAPPDHREGLRDLADVVNRRVLEAALDGADHRPLAGDVESLYRALTDGESGAAERTRARRRLERAGVDVESLRADFVSHSAVRTYLRSHRDASYEPEPAPLERADTAIARLQGRLEAVTVDRLAAARRRDAIALGEHDVTVSVRVACRDCGRQVDVATLLNEGGCACG